MATWNGSSSWQEIESQGTSTQINGHVNQVHIHNSDRETDCLAHLHTTDPRHDKQRIEHSKGELLKDSYRWILEHADFRRWRDDSQNRLLWIRGDPGKGKTMLICGIINELQPTTKLADPKANPEPDQLLSYFFCQATDDRLNKATAVLRGLIYMLVAQQPSLITHVQKRYDIAGKALYEPPNAWFALSDIFTDILRDSILKEAYLIIDALDECVTDLPELLDFIITSSRFSRRVKWLLSSRNESLIERHMRIDNTRERLSLELKDNAEYVSRAVNVYINNKVAKIESLQDDDQLRDLVRIVLCQKANGTFLWVALVVQELERVDSWDVKQVLEDLPTGLDALYARMVLKIQQLGRRNPEFCQQVLSIALVTYRPLHLLELGILSGLPNTISNKANELSKIVSMCGSFLTVRDSYVYFIHQSAKDYLVDSPPKSFCFTKTGIHHDIFSRSLALMSRILRRDIYGLTTSGFPIGQVSIPNPDPLAPAQYSCIYWIDHLYHSELASNKKTDDNHDLQDGGTVYEFLKKQYLHWLEALSLLRRMPEGVIAMRKMGELKQHMGSRLADLVQDAQRFVLSHKWIIENAPLQVYVSALLFSPTQSIVRQLFQLEEPGWITRKPIMEANWNPCTQTLEGHGGNVNSVACSPDSKQLASGSDDRTVKVWDVASGTCIQTFDGHSDIVWSVAFSPSGQLASGSDDRTVKVWDVASGTCIQTFDGHSDVVWSVAFSPNGQLASGSNDSIIKVWDLELGTDTQTFKGHSGMVHSVAFSPDSKQLVSGSGDHTIKVWNIEGPSIQTLKGHDSMVGSIAVSPNNEWLVSGSDDHSIKVWDIVSGTCIQTLKGHSNFVRSVAFSPNGKRLVSGSWDHTIKVWNIEGSSGQTLKGHGGIVWSVAFAPNGQYLVSGSDDRTVKVWDIEASYIQALERHSGLIRSMAFSLDGKLLVSGSGDHTIKVWDIESGGCLQTLKGHNGGVWSIAFSPDGKQLASGSRDHTVKIWDTVSGDQTQTLRGHGGRVLSVTFSPDGKKLASGSGDFTIKVWDIVSKFDTCIQTLKGHNGVVWSIAFSPNSQQLVSGSDDCTVKTWDIRTGTCIQTFEDHGGMVSAVAFSLDGKQLVSASDDRTIKVWNIASGACMQTTYVGVALRKILFETGHLLTDVGYINLAGTSPGPSVVATCAASTHEFQRLQETSRSGYGIGTDRSWITYNSRNILWLPPEYRPGESVVLGRVVGIGSVSGRVLIMKFSHKIV